MMRFAAIKTSIQRKLPLLFSFVSQRKRLLYVLLWFASLFLSYALPYVVLKILLLPFVLLPGIGLLLRRKIGFRRTLLILLLIPLLAFSLSLYHRAPTERLRPYEGKEALVSLCITDMSLQKDTATASLLSINGKRLSASIALTLPKDSSFEIGDILSGVTKEISLPSRWQVAEGMDGRMTLEIAQKTGEKHTLFSWAAELNNRLSSLLQERVSAEEGALLSALLLGERDGLSDRTSLALMRTGTSHMLALSGMHFSMIVGGVGFLLGGIHKKKRYVLLIGLLLFYTLLTGLAPSILRACFMSLFAFSAFLAGRANNSLFSLLVALSVIFFFEPYAVFSLSLWLSALATAGILLFLARREKREREEGKASFRKRVLLYIKDYLLLSCAITTAATVAVLPLSAYYFGTYSLVSLPANLLLAPLMQLSLYGAILVLLLGFFAPIAHLARGAAFLFLRLATLLSSVPHTQISLNRPISFAAVLVCFLLVVLYFILTPAASFKMRRLLSFLLVLGLALSSVHLADTYLYKNGVRLCYAAKENESADVLCIRESTETFIIAVGSHEAQLANTVKDTMSTCYRQELDGYLLTDYQENTETHIKTLCENTVVRSILLPSPLSPAEIETAERLSAWSKECRTPLVFYQANENVPLGKTVFSVPLRYMSDCFSLSLGKERILYLSADALQSGDALLLSPLLQKASVVICGTSSRLTSTPLPESMAQLFEGKELWCRDKAALPASLSFETKERYDKSIFALRSIPWIKEKKNYN